MEQKKMVGYMNNFLQSVKKGINRLRLDRYFPVYLSVFILGVLLKFLKDDLGNELIGAAFIFFVLRFFLLDATHKEKIAVMNSSRDIYLAAITNLGEDWDKIRIFAPVGFWENNEYKRLWFNELAKTAQKDKSLTVECVFGLPPIYEEQTGELRDKELLLEELKHFEETLRQFNGLVNVRIRYYPPFGASLAVGAIIFEKRGQGQVAFGLVCKVQNEVLDSAFGLDQEDIFSAFIKWFDDRIFGRAVSRYILQEPRIPFDSTWKSVQEKHYSLIFTQEED